MNTRDLRRAYAQFIDAVQTGNYHAPAHGWSAELVLAHVIVGDRQIAEAAAKVILGQPVIFDNLASQSEAYLRAVAAAAGDWDGLIAAVKRGGEELAGVLDGLTQEHAATPVPCRIVSDNNVIMDATVPLSQLVSVPVTTHLRMHQQQLAELTAPVASASSA